MTGICFPKYVIIANPQLLRLYVIVMFLSAGALTFLFYYLRLWVVEITMKDRIHVSMWVEGQGEDGTSAFNKSMALWEDKSKSPLCTSSSDFDYWYDSSGQWKAENITCLQPCGKDHENTNKTCIHPSRQHRREEQDRVLLFTMIKKHRTLDNGAHQTDSYFIPTVDALMVKFAFFFAIPEKNPYRRSPSLSDSSAMQRGFSRLDVTTIILDSERKIYRTISPPNTGINISVPELLLLSGKPELLDAEQAGLSQNFKPGAKYTQGPVARVSGSQIDLNVLCYSKSQHPDDDTDGPVCYITVANQNTWAYSSSADSTDMDMLSHKILPTFEYYGIRVKAISGGTWEFTDANMCYLNIVSMVILLTYIKTAFQYGTTNLLGQLSTIYSRAVYQQFHIGDQMGSLMANLVSRVRSFQMEEDTPGDGISREMLERKLVEVVETQRAKEKKIGEAVEAKGLDPAPILEAKRLCVLNDEDLKTFANLAYASIISPRWLETFTDLARIRRSCSRLVENLSCNSIKRLCKRLIHFGRSQTSNFVTSNEVVTTTKRHIDLPSFVQAHERSEPDNMYDFMRLLNKERKRSCMEMIFTPPYIHELQGFQEALTGTDEILVDPTGHLTDFGVPHGESIAIPDRPADGFQPSMVDDPVQPAVAPGITPETADRPPDETAAASRGPQCDARS